MVLGVGAGVGFSVLGTLGGIGLGIGWVVGCWFAGFGLVAQVCLWLVSLGVWGVGFTVAGLDMGW